MQNETNNHEHYIIGRNAVAEALKSGRKIDTLLISSDCPSGSLKAILAKAKDQKIIIKKISKKALDMTCPGATHQGVIAVASIKETCKISDILNYAKSKNEPAFIVVADGIEDPHNLGSIIRTAECAGAHGVIIPKRRSVGLSAAVEKCSAGALEHMLIAKVGSLNSAIEELKKNGLWIYCADMDGKNFTQENLTGPVALVIGSEGSGVSKLIKEKCDFVLSIPICGKINSLNASVAAGILMYEVRRQRDCQ